jgi:hypothetical protein
MLRSKLGLLSLCALALGLMAFASSAQAAPEWLILTVKDPEGPHVAKTAAELPAAINLELEENMGTLLTKLTGLAVSVLCTGASLQGAKLEGGGKVTEGFMATFTGCTVPVPAGNICTVKSVGSAVGTILTLELKGQLQANGEVLIQPKVAGGAFVHLIFEGATCTLPTEVQQLINGVLWIKDCENMAELHLVKHLIIESREHGNTLFVGSDTAEHLETRLDGSAWTFLIGEHLGLLWGAMFP